MATIATAVVGVGYLGRFHAHKYAELPGSELIAVVDTDTKAAQATAAALGVEAHTDYRALRGRVEAVSVVVPTGAHFEIARDLLAHGAHVLVEKPIAETVAQAAALVELAEARQRVLQVGHLERFNSAILDLDRLLAQPMFIECHRLAPFRPRGTDVSVVLDLMIHDIDIILNIVKSDPVRIDASGAAVLSEAVDIANARLAFANGCVANVTASRVSTKTERKLRIFQQNAYISIDLQAHTLAHHRKGAGEMYPGVPEIERELSQHAAGDPLKTEIAAFLEAVRTGARPLVAGVDGQRALQTAMRITDLVTAAAGVGA